MRNLVILGGSSHPTLVDRICHNLNIEAGDATLKKFSNGETSITIKESVREKDVYVIQSGCGSVNDNFIELLVMISACKTASAKKVTAILPLFPYSRQPDAPYARKGAPLKHRSQGSTSQSSSGPSAIAANSSAGKTFTFESVPSSPRPSTAVNGSANGGANLLQLGASLKALSRPQFTSRHEQSWSPADHGHAAHHLETNTGYKEWVAQPGSLIASLLTCAGADHIITMDLHDPQFQGYFDVPVDNLYGRPLLQHYITSSIPNYMDAVIVSPDAGGAKRATAVADALGMSFALIHKERRRAPVPSTPTGGYLVNGGSLNNAVSNLSLNPTNGTASPSSSNNNSYTNLAGLNRNETTYGVLGHRRLATTMLVGNVRDRVAILIDDLVDTANTITRAAKLLKDQGATHVYALITHGIFSGDAIERINASAIDKVITTNTTPQDDHAQLLGDKIEVLDVSRVFGEAIRRIHNGESVSMLFDYVGF